MSIRMGQYNELAVIRESEHGLILDGGEDLGDVLLPQRYVDEVDPPEPGETMEVFLYRDSEDRPVATTETPIGVVGDRVTLEVIDASQIGAFLDWGLAKDLLLPFANQIGRPRRGDRILVEILIDPVTDRLVATQKLNGSKDGRFPEYRRGERVHALVGPRTEIGWSVIVDDNFLGMLYANEVFRELEEGDQVDAYVKEIREDGRIELKLEALGYQGQIPGLRNQILVAVKAARGGFLPLHDKSSPEEIRRTFSCSKKNFKKALGALYRAGQIRMDGDGIRLIEEE